MRIPKLQLSLYLGLPDCYIHWIPIDTLRPHAESNEQLPDARVAEDPAQL